MNDNPDLWHQLFLRCEAIAAIDPTAADARAQLLGQLAAVTTAFGQTFDPADQFEQYTAVALCQAIERVLGRLP